MSVRAVLYGLLRGIGVIIASLAVALALGYVILTSPPGLRWLANTISSQAASAFGWRLEIGSLDSDLYSYLVLRHARLAFSEEGTQISVNRLHVRMSAWKLLRGRLNGMERLSVDSLTIMIPLREDTTSPEWSIAPVLPYVPAHADVRGLTLRLASSTDTTTLAFKEATLRAFPSAEDSSLLADLNVTGSMTLGGLGVIPFSGDGRLLFAGPSLRINGLIVKGPGIMFRGYAVATDLVRGPYRGGGLLRVELADLPRRASGLDLSGTVTIQGAVGWDERPTIEASLESPAVRTPWVSLSDAAFRLDTSDSLVSVRGRCVLAQGDFGIAASAPVPPLHGPLRLDLALVNADLEDAARIPVVRESLAGTRLNGRATVRWQYEGQVRRWRSTGVKSLSTRVELSTDSLTVNDVSLGRLSAYWAQERTRTRGALHALGLNLSVDGTARSVEDVTLATDMHAEHVDTLLRALGVEGIDGEIAAHATVSGALASPEVRMQVKARNPVLPWVSLADLTLDAQMGANGTVSALLTSADSLVRAEAVIGNRFAHLDRLSASLGPWPVSAFPGDIETTYHLSGTVRAELSGGGPLANPHLRALVRTTPLTWEQQDLGSIWGEADWLGGVLTLEARNEENTFGVQGTVASDSGAQSNLVCYWERFQLGSILAALTKQDIRQVAGISDGTIRATWSQKVPGSFVLQARVERAQVRLGNVTYELANPPARFELAGGTLTLPLVRLEGERQHLFLEGSITQAGDLDFTAVVDSVDVGNLVGFATAGALRMEGTLEARMHVGGIVKSPVANGFVAVKGLQWRSFAVDSLGSRVSLAADTLRVPDLYARFPFGNARGALTATTSALGLPAASGATPEFVADLLLDHASVFVPNWEGLRSGTIVVSGGLHVRGSALAEVRSYEGTLRIDSLSLTAPFNRTVRTVQPALVKIGTTNRPLVTPLGLQVRYRGSDVGRITLAHPPDTTVRRLDLEIDRLSLEDARHIALPLLSALRIGPLPEDLTGFLSATGSWNMDLQAPRANAQVCVREPLALGISSDSLTAALTFDGGHLALERGYLFAGGDTLSVEGLIDPAADTVAVRMHTRRLELVQVLTELLPPLRRYEPPPPLPTTMPLPGYGQQVQYLPPDARGANVSAPLTTFDKLMKARGESVKHPYAAMLPVDGDLELRGSFSEPSLYGEARLLGGYLEMESVVEPFWLPDTVVVRFLGKKIIMPHVQVFVGAEQRRTAEGQPRINLEQASYSLTRGSFDIAAQVNRATFSVISTEPVVVPPRLRFMSLILEPLLTSYYTEPVGVFTADARLRWQGTMERSHLTGDVQLYSSTFQYPIADPAALLKPPSPTSLGPMLDNAELSLNVSTEDSLVISNNLSKYASVWIQMAVSGHHYSPQLQGRVEVSPGSVFRYFGREFSVERATIDFPDPTRFEPELDIQAHATVTDPTDKNAPTYEVTLNASGVFPNLVRTEMSAEERPSGEVIVSQLEIMEILIYGRRSPNYLAFDAQGRLNTYLKNRGYATLSTALGSVIPVDRVTVREQEPVSAENAVGGDQQAANQSNVEVEVAQSFRIFGQKVTVTAATPVGQISNVSNLQRVEVRWLIVNRPQRWPFLESLSLTVGQNPFQDPLKGDLHLQNELTADVQLRVRFR